jgi:anti-sigma B factor antagonist
VVTTTIPEAGRIGLPMLGPLTIVTWQPAPDVAVMRVAGEVDLFTAPSFQDTVHQQLGRPLLVLVIDLSPVTFFGASGLTVLVAAHELAEQRAIALRLVCETRTVTRLLAMVGLDETFETYTSLGTALTTG